MRKPHVLSLSVQNLAHFPQLPSRGKIQRWISRALENDAQITVRFVEEEEGWELNKTYRGKDYATNVLTFDYQVEPVVEADLVICVPCLKKNQGPKQNFGRAHGPPSRPRDAACAGL